MKITDIITEGKIKGADGKACWKGKRYAGTENGKDKCIPVKEARPISKPEDAVAAVKKFTAYVKRNIVDLGSMASFKSKYSNQPYVDKRFEGFLTRADGTPVTPIFNLGGKLKLVGPNKEYLNIPIEMYYRFQGLMSGGVFEQDILKQLGYQQGVAEGDVVAFPKKHKGDLEDTHSCVKCGGDLQGGTYMGHKVKVCIPCKQVYLPPNSGIDQKGNKIKESAIKLDEFAPGNGEGGGQWLTDDQIADIVGEDWYEFDVSGDQGNIPMNGERARLFLVQEAEAYLRDRGYNVNVLDVKDMDDNLAWYISGALNEDWQKANRRDKTAGMSKKAVKAYRRENPGSKLQTAVTTKPSKLKPGSKAAKRRKSFCARMSGNKGPMKDEKGRPTPKAKALRRWNCE